jgi:hypothetical protein
MLGWIGVAVINLVTIMFSMPSEAAFLLNCRLMGPATPPHWRQGCKWETVIRECNPEKLCKVKRLNIISRSAKAAITANVKWRTTVIISGTTSEAASIVETMNGPAGLATSGKATAADSTVSSTIGAAVGTVNRVVSGATGAVDRTVAGLVP